MRSLLAQRSPAASSVSRQAARSRAGCVAVKCSAHRCHYRVLGVSPAASGDEIKSAFRKLAKEKHPDVAGHTTAANEEFKAVKAAWDVLGNAESKAQYDGELRTAAAAKSAPAAASRAAHHRSSTRSPADWGVPSKPPPPVPAGARHMRTEHEAAGPHFVSFVGVTQPQPPHAAGHAAHSGPGATTTASAHGSNRPPAASAASGSAAAASASTARGSDSQPGSAGAWWAHWPPRQPNSSQQPQPAAQPRAAGGTSHVVRSRQAATKSRRVVRSFHPVDEGPAHPTPAGAPRMRMDTEDESFVSFVGVHSHPHQPEQEWQPGHRDHVVQLSQQQQQQPQHLQQQQHAPHHAQHRPHQQHHQH